MLFIPRKKSGRLLYPSQLTEFGGIALKKLMYEAAIRY